MATDHLETLTLNQMAALVGSLKNGVLRHDLSPLSLKATVPSLTDLHIETLTSLGSNRWNSGQLIYLLTSLQKSQETQGSFSHLVDLVISGPSIPQVPTRTTRAVFHELVAGLEKEILVVSFAIYNGKTLLKPLAEKLEANSSISAKFVLNIQRGRNDKTISGQLVRKFKREFLENMWPGTSFPELFHFPQSLEIDWKTRASLHSKIIVIDRKRLFISSANLTDAAHEKNIETGVVLEHPASAIRIVNYFEALEKEGLIVKV